MVAAGGDKCVWSLPQHVSLKNSTRRGLSFWLFPCVCVCVFCVYVFVYFGVFMFVLLFVCVCVRVCVCVSGATWKAGGTCGRCCGWTPAFRRRSGSCRR